MDLPVDYDKLTRQQRREVRLEYVRLQEGKCWHCKNPLDGPATDEIMAKKIDFRLFPGGFLDYPVHLHHNHFNGMTIGAIHCHCNAVLWQYHGQ